MIKNYLFPIDDKNYKITQMNSQYSGIYLSFEKDGIRVSGWFDNNFDLGIDQLIPYSFIKEHMP